MRIKLIKASDINISRWPGGISQQYYIYPETASYAERNFIFRMSLATAELEEESFYTNLPDITRHLVMLEGSAKVVHHGHYELMMHPYQEIDVFDGAWVSSGQGRVTDFNLMVKGAVGKMSVVAESGAVFVEQLVQDEAKYYTGLFCGAEQAKIKVAGQEFSLGYGDMLVAEEISTTTEIWVELQGGKCVKMDVAV